MLLPSTTQSALLLLGLALVCLGSWFNFFKTSKWRYELFYFDFAVGAVVLAALCAYTLGTLGSEMSFADRTVVAGLRSQALAFGAGFTFGLGNLLLLAGIALGGMAIAVPLALSLAFLTVGLSQSVAGPPIHSPIALVLYLASFVSLLLAAIRRFGLGPGKKPLVSRPGTSTPLKMISVCILAGLLIGTSQPIADAAFWGDLGLGPYAGALLFCLGVAGATLLFDIFFMNMGLVGGRVTLPSYRQGSFRQHAMGILAGIVWSAGLLTGSLAHSIPGELPVWTIWLERGWVLLAILWGSLLWKELGPVKPARVPLTIGSLAFAAAIAAGSVAAH